MPWELLSQNWPWPNIYMCTHKACSCYCQTCPTHGSTSNLLTCPPGTEFAKLPTGIDPHNCWNTQILALLPSHTAPGHLLGFQPHLCMWPTHWCFHPPRTRRGGAVPTVRMSLLWEWGCSGRLHLSSEAWRLTMVPQWWTPIPSFAYPRCHRDHTPVPSACLCTANPRPLPRPVLWSPSLSAQPLPTPANMHLRLGTAARLPVLPMLVSMFHPLQTGYCTLLRAPSVLADLPASEGASQGKGTPSFHSPLPRVQVPTQIPALCFFCPPGHLSILPTTLVLWAPLPAAFSRYSVKVVPRVDVFWLFLGTGELHFLLFHSLDLAKHVSL